MFARGALAAVWALLLIVGLSAASLVAAGDSDRTVRGTVGGGKTYNVKIRKTRVGKEVAYVFRVRRRARITATITNTGPNIDGQFDCFNAGFLNAEGEDIDVLDNASCITPGRTDRVRERLRPGKYFLNFSIITDPVQFRFRLTPKRAIRKPG